MWFGRLFVVEYGDLIILIVGCGVIVLFDLYDIYFFVKFVFYILLFINGFVIEIIVFFYICLNFFLCYLWLVLVFFVVCFSVYGINCLDIYFFFRFFLLNV